MVLNRPRPSSPVLIFFFTIWRSSMSAGHSTEAQHLDLNAQTHMESAMSPAKGPAVRRDVKRIMGPTAEPISHSQPAPSPPPRKPLSPPAPLHALILKGARRSQHNPHCFKSSWCASAPSAPPPELLASSSSPSAPDGTSASPLDSFPYLPPNLPDNTPPAPHPHPPVGASQLTAMATLTNQNLAGINQPLPFS